MVETVKLSRDDFNLAKRNPRFSSFLVSSKPQGNHERNHKLWNIASTERDKRTTDTNNEFQSTTQNIKD
jgi:hypothetical protein